MSVCHIGSYSEDICFTPLSLLYFLFHSQRGEDSFSLQDTVSSFEGLSNRLSDSGVEESLALSSAISLLRDSTRELSAGLEEDEGALELEEDYTLAEG
ncbi:hypothetical protein P9112_010016 [Eukaryota sp. TZLM1-RC]